MRIKYFYLYRTTNRLNGMTYVGVRQTYKEPTTDSYLGSGTRLKLAVRKHGVHNFSKEVLDTFTSAVDMYAAEKEMVTEDFVARDDTYNLVEGGLGGDRISMLPDLSDYKMRRSKQYNEFYETLSMEDRKRMYGHKKAAIGGESCFLRKSGIHDPSWDKAIGGRVGGSVSGKLFSTTAWYTNGVQRKRIQVSESVEFERNNPTWYKGRDRR